LKPTLLLPQAFILRRRRESQNQCLLRFHIKPLRRRKHGDYRSLVKVGRRQLGNSQPLRGQPISSVSEKTW